MGNIGERIVMSKPRLRYFGRIGLLLCSCPVLNIRAYLSIRADPGSVSNVVKVEIYLGPGHVERARGELNVKSVMHSHCQMHAHKIH